jgi:hypothetical protein
MDARARAEALAHEAACGPCAARLADERALTAGLRTLAANDAHLEAPPRVEAALLAAFRARHANRPAAHADTNASHAAAQTSADQNLATLETGSPAASNVASLESGREFRRWTWAKSVATAATAAAAAAVLLMIVIPGDAPPLRNDATRAAATSQTGVVAETATARRETALSESPVEARLAGAASGPRELVAAAPQSEVYPSEANLSKTGFPSSPNAPRATRASMRTAGYERGGGGGASRARNGRQAAEPAAEEFTTDFIPLYQAEQAAPVMAGTLVRVELPRSSLSRFGLPVNAERAGERIKADVLLGEDGMARAIRFVR